VIFQQVKDVLSGRCFGLDAPPVLRFFRFVFHLLIVALIEALNGFWNSLLI
jgi:hypothetical protein